MSPEFLDPFEARQVDWRAGRPWWMTLVPLRYQSPRTGQIVVPAEFITDGASVPRLPLLWWIAGGRGYRSATLHDYAYQTGTWLRADGAGVVSVTRAMVDRVFYESLIADPFSGTGEWLAQQMWAAVRLAGRGIWGSGRRRAALNPIWTTEGWPSAP